MLSCDYYLKSLKEVEKLLFCQAFFESKFHGFVRCLRLTIYANNRCIEKPLSMIKLSTNGLVAISINTFLSQVVSKINMVANIGRRRSKIIIVLYTCLHYLYTSFL